MQPSPRQTIAGAFAARHELTPAKIKLLALLVLLAGHVVASLWFIVPGYLSIDEALYHLMLKNFANTGGLEIWTGYQEFPSLELSHQFLRVHFGRPVSQYPYLFPVVALPFFKLAGFYGLFLLNSLAFVGVVVLCFATAQRLFGDIDLSLNACLVLILATFAWEYSQAAWPHETSLLFITGAFYLAVRAFFAMPGKQRWMFSLAAGLVAGFAPGIRMDAFLLLPCILLPFLFARPWRPVEALLICLAAVPGVSILAVTNYIKFGVLSPFSYGTGPTGHTPAIPLTLVAAASAILFGAWVVTREAFMSAIRGRGRGALGIAAAALILVVLVPQLRHLVYKILNGANMMLVDLRVLDIHAVEQALGRTSQGGLVYIGALKKSLLQSMPYLVVLVLPLIALFKRGKDFAALSMLFLPLAVVTSFFAYSQDHGGLCLNLRFFLPALPFTSILAAYAMRRMHSEWGAGIGPLGWAGLILLTAAAYFFVMEDVPLTLDELEFALLVVPLLMAGFLLLLLLAGEFLKVQGAELLQKAAWVLLIVALTWSGAVAFCYDFPHHRRQRVTNYFLGEHALRVIPPDSVFFTAPYIDPFMRLIEKDGVRIALPGQDNFQDFPGIVAFYLEKGKRVFAVFPIQYWKRLNEGSLSNYTVTPLLRFPGSYMAEISAKTEAKDAPEDG